MLYSDECDLWWHYVSKCPHIDDTHGGNFFFRVAKSKRNLWKHLNEFIAVRMFLRLMEVMQFIFWFLFFFSIWWKKIFAICLNRIKFESVSSFQVITNEIFNTIFYIYPLCSFSLDFTVAGDICLSQSSVNPWILAIVVEGDYFRRLPPWSRNDW